MPFPSANPYDPRWIAFETACDGNPVLQEAIVGRIDAAAMWTLLQRVDMLISLRGIQPVLVSGAGAEPRFRGTSEILALAKKASGLLNASRGKIALLVSKDRGWGYWGAVLEASLTVYGVRFRIFESEESAAEWLHRGR